MDDDDGTPEELLAIARNWKSNITPLHDFGNFFQPSFFGEFPPHGTTTTTTTTKLQALA
jgi:predicted alpha/beta hydrolase family esterase